MEPLALPRPNRNIARADLELTPSFPMETSLPWEPPSRLIRVDRGGMLILIHVVIFLKI